MATRRLRIPRRRQRVRERGHTLRLPSGRRLPVRGLPYADVRAAGRAINRIGAERREASDA